MHKSLYLLVAWALISFAQTYPPVPVSGTGDWVSAVTKAKSLVAQMTTDEKVNITAGGGWQEGPCVGNTRPVPRLNFQSICLQDSPLGVRYADFVSAFPAGINAAATWDRTMIYNRGVAIGQEFRGKGVNVALGPMMNMGRVAAGGRNWEGFGAEPYLAGEAAAQTIQGIQSTGVIATAKHYIGNEQEHSRDTESSNIDDRTAHEIYLYPFAQSVKAGVGAVMCSYNQLNGTYACENDHSLNFWLKNQLGFQGFVMSDWDATHSGVKSALAGLDMDMPGDTGFSHSTTNGYFISTLASAVKSGSLPQSQLDDMVTRILASWYKLGQDQGFPSVNFNSWNGGGSHIDVQSTHKNIIRQMGAASTVLLKNSNNILPLNKPRSIAIIGSDAGPNPNPNEFTDRGGVDGTLAMGWGSGTVNFPYLIAPIDALQAQASNDSTIVTVSHSDTDITGAISAAEKSDIAIVFGLSDSGEDYITVDGNEGDRNNLSLWNNVDQLVQAVAGVNKNTVVVIHSVGPIIMPWATNPNVTAIVWAGIPGQESGNALIDVLYGAYNPSGRLPYTIAKQRSDYSADVLYNSPSTITYSEGLYIDYRWFDYKNIQPQYEFGFGLSYTTFSYSNATAQVSTNNTVTVTLSIMNSGKVTGNEVAQLYLGFPASAGEPPKILKGFEKISLTPNQSSTVTFQLTINELSIWDTPSQSWVIPSGSYTAFVGASSRDIRTTVTFNINGGSLSSSSSSSSSTQSTFTSTTSKSTSTQPSSTSFSSSVSTTTSTAPSTSSSGASCATHWAQCGGISYNGPTCCQSPYTCQYSNPYYSQCL